MSLIIGRTEEKQEFKRIRNSHRSEFVAVYGRRRIGKTYLIRNIFNNRFDFYFTGLANAGQKQQLENFHTAMGTYFRGSRKRHVPGSWYEAFQQLATALKKKGKQKKVIFIDELPWLDTPRSGFISALEHFWNAWADARKDIILIVCGSAASWMINKLINNRGGLHNRLTSRIHLEPFTLGECEAFLHAKGAHFDRYQLIQLYMVMGGVPYYLEHIDPGKSVVQNINAMCFNSRGVLRNEFNNLFASLFRKSENHIAVVEALARKAKGLSREELIRITGLTNGGGLSRLLNELEESSFIRRYSAFGKQERHSMYQLIDFYSLFYLRYIRKANKQDSNFWLNNFDSPAMRSWSGYAFEQVCLHHIDAIKNALGIGGILTETSAWICPDKKKPVQIDLVIDRADRVVTICEMKFAIHPFVISRKYEEELIEKLIAFRAHTRTRKAVFLAMITTYGLQQKRTLSNLVQNDLRMDVLFRHPGLY